MIFDILLHHAHIYDEEDHRAESHIFNSIYFFVRVVNVKCQVKRSDDDCIYPWKRWLRRRLNYHLCSLLMNMFIDTSIQEVLMNFCAHAVSSNEKEISHNHNKRS